MLKLVLSVAIALLISQVAYAQNYNPYESSQQRQKMPTPAYGAGENSNSVSVDGYYRKDGTYVETHQRSAPNSTVNDNWSTKGNENPYTGKAGTKHGQW